MVSDKESDEFWESLYSRAVNYEIIETEDGNFFFTTDDSNIPHESGSKFDSITTTQEGRFGYHSFIGVEELSSRKENPKKFVFVICPFLVKNNTIFSRILGGLVAKADYGKKNIVIEIIGRTAFSVSLEKGHSATEICKNTFEFVPHDRTGIMTNLEIVSETYEKVRGLTRLSPQYRSPLCPYCNNGQFLRMSQRKAKSLIEKIQKFDFAIKFSEQFGNIEFVDFRIISPLEKGKTHLVTAKISGSTKNGFLDLAIIDPDGKSYWFPDPHSYNSSFGNGNLNFENDTFESKWEFSIPDKSGKYRAVMALYENNAENRSFVNYEKYEFIVN